MSWHLAPVAQTFRAQIDSRFPNRSKDQDGTIGDADHSARKSDHNPDDDRSVNALDITHDPNGGVDCNRLARELADIAKRDRRIEYVIWNRQIWSQQRPFWRAYTGSNGHTKHCHVSFTHGPGERDASPIALPMLGGKPGTASLREPNTEYPALSEGSSGAKVKLWQQMIGVKDDGKFGAATKAATAKWQSENGLSGDGVVGPKTWGIALQKLTAFINAGKATKIDSKVYPSLKQGDKGEKVTLWQQIIGAKADGQFGPATKQLRKPGRPTSI